MRHIKLIKSLSRWIFTPTPVAAAAETVDAPMEEEAELELDEEEMVQQPGESDKDHATRLKAKLSALKHGLAKRKVKSASNKK